MRCMVALVAHFLLGQDSFHRGWHPSHKGASRYIAGDNSSGSHKGSLTNRHAIQHDRSDSHKAAVLQRAAVHDGTMPNCDVGANPHSLAGIAVQNSTVLNVAAWTNRDGRHIGPGDCCWPKAGACRHFDVAHDDRCLRHPSIGIDARRCG